MSDNLAGVSKARVTVTRDGDQDAMVVAVEGEGEGDTAALAALVQSTLKLRAPVEIVAAGALPNDGKVIDDQRSYDT
ncbi:MAG: hypothetical protein AAGP08_05380 [Pseudomonadota bacterium]